MRPVFGNHSLVSVGPQSGDSVDHLRIPEALLPKLEWYIGPLRCYLFRDIRHRQVFQHRGHLSAAGWVGEFTSGDGKDGIVIQRQNKCEIILYFFFVMAGGADPVEAAPVFP